MSQELQLNVKSMQDLIKAITIEGKRSEKLILAKATSAMEYDMGLAIAMTRLKADGHPTTTLEKMSKGEADVAEKLMGKITAEETIKAHYSRMDNLKAQLCGFQSINRHLSTGVV